LLLRFACSIGFASWGLVKRLIQSIGQFGENVQIVSFDMAQDRLSVRSLRLFNRLRLWEDKGRVRKKRACSWGVGVILVGFWGEG
jgi:hypothetical protein